MVPAVPYTMQDGSRIWVSLAWRCRKGGVEAGIKSQEQGVQKDRQFCGNSLLVSGGKRKEEDRP